MKLSNIILGGEYAVRRSEYDAPNRVRAVEVVTVDPPPSATRWVGTCRRVILPGEKGYGYKPEKRVRIEVVGNAACYLGDRDSQQRRWLPPRAKAHGLVKPYEPTPTCDVLSVTFSRETLARVLDALDAVVERR